MKIHARKKKYRVWVAPVSGGCYYSFAAVPWEGVIATLIPEGEVVPDLLLRLHMQYSAGKDIWLSAAELPEGTVTNKPSSYPEGWKVEWIRIEPDRG